MSAWEIISEEASIVLVGNINPKIFHPEWFIGKSIVEEWDYSNEEVINLPDMAQLTLPGKRMIVVLFNQFSVRSPLASEHFTLKDLVTHTFAILSETPITQMGMNYNSVIKISDIDKWMQFSLKLAPHECWKQAAGFIEELNEEKQKELGLWEMSMNLPRPDELSGFIRPKIAIFPAIRQTLQLSINNHIEIDASGTIMMNKVLEDNWEQSLALAKRLTSNIMSSQLGNNK